MKRSTVGMLGAAGVVTAGLLAVFRFGSYVPVPGVNADRLAQALQNKGTTNILNFLNLFAGGALTRFAVFALGIMPYITASIILQLLTVVIPSLERLQKEFPDKDMGELVKLADAEVAAEIERRKAETGPNKIEVLNDDGSVAQTLEMQ